jgi:hypothetical protein
LCGVDELAADKRFRELAVRAVVVAIATVLVVAAATVALAVAGAVVRVDAVLQQRSGSRIVRSGHVELPVAAAAVALLTLLVAALPVALIGLLGGALGGEFLFDDVHHRLGAHPLVGLDPVEGLAALRARGEPPHDRFGRRGHQDGRAVLEAHDVAVLVLLGGLGLDDVEGRVQHVGRQVHLLLVAADAALTALAAPLLDLADLEVAGERVVGLQLGLGLRVLLGLLRGIDEGLSVELQSLREPEVVLLLRLADEARVLRGLQDLLAGEQGALGQLQHAAQDLAVRHHELADRVLLAAVAAGTHLDLDLGLGGRGLGLDDGRDDDGLGHGGFDRRHDGRELALVQPGQDLAGGELLQLADVGTLADQRLDRREAVDRQPTLRAQPLGRDAHLDQLGRGVDRLLAAVLDDVVALGRRDRLTLEAGQIEVAMEKDDDGLLELVHDVS